MSDDPQQIRLALENNDHCKRLNDPIEPHVYHLEAFLRFDEAAKLVRGNANVRPPNTKKPAYVAMVETVEGSPQAFHAKNRGITYFCDRFEFDNAKHQLTITLPRLGGDDETKFGIADGGHTFAVVQDTLTKIEQLQATEGWAMPFVRVHFVAGSRADLLTSDESIVEALNTSSQVQQYTLDEYANQFEGLKDALAASGFDPDLVAWRENEDKEWHVVEIIQRMACFLREKWQLTQPASMYRSKGKALELFTGEATRGEFAKLYPVIRDVITLPEFIESALSSGNMVKLRSFGKLRAVKALKKPYTRAGTDYATNHRLDLGAVLPMAAAFRELLVSKGSGGYKWRVPPQRVFEKCADQLYQVMVQRLQKARIVSQLGADMEYWSACVPIVMRAKDDLLA